MDSHGYRARAVAVCRLRDREHGQSGCVHCIKLCVRWLAAMVLRRGTERELLSESDCFTIQFFMRADAAIGRGEGAHREAFVSS